MALMRWCRPVRQSFRTEAAIRNLLTNPVAGANFG
jgi:hypothetical protein